jgi:Protein of unknown function DUF262/HNH endonuclease
MTGQLGYQYGDKTILELKNLQEGGHLNLEPGFQRQSVWTDLDRRKLIQSVLDGFPVPSIFLYRREENGMPVYDVIDGKQRLETIFKFCRAAGFKRHSFPVRYQFSDDDAPYWYDWSDLNWWRLTAPFLSYRIQTVEVSGELADIVDLFVRINSTGKSLTSSEKRHARFYTSPFLKEAQRLARGLQRSFRTQRILSPNQIARMKDVELISELIASVNVGGPIDRKVAVDRAVGNEALKRQTLAKVSKEVLSTFKAVKKVFPDLRSTRFRNSSEFYSLFMVFWECRHNKLVLTDRKRNKAANALLVGYSNGVDHVRELQKGLRKVPREYQEYANYLLSVQQSTDKLNQRQRRAEILRGLFSGLFEKKDEHRGFSPEQRRLLWNSDEKKRCRDCRSVLDWANFQIDHVKPHSLGGKTVLKNAEIVCRSRNARKGARRGPKRRAA